jgi:hypothetical protein
MPQTTDLFPDLPNPNPYFKTGATSIAAALLCENIPFIRIEGTQTDALFVFDNYDGNAERVAAEYSHGELWVIASIFSRNRIKVRDILNAFQRGTSKRGLRDSRNPNTPH